jgi:hypothetical protein
MLSVNHDGAYPELSEEEMQAAFQAVGAFNEKITSTGKWVFGGGLEPRETATTVRLQDDKTTVLTDGPYAETKEFLGGFWVVEAEDLDEALALGREAAVACAGDVEVRPFQSEPED